MSRWPAIFLALWISGCATSDRPLQLISGAGPIYPAAARAEGVEGYAIVQYDVDVQGRVINARVVEGEPAGVFDEAALTTVKSWKFNPAVREGQPVVSLARRSTVTFQLGDTSRYDQYD